MSNQDESRAPAEAAIIPGQAENGPAPHSWAPLPPTRSLFQEALTKLANNPVTSTIPAKLKDPTYDEDFGEWICNVMQKICDKRNYPFDEAVEDLIDVSYDFLSLQLELDNTGSYACKSFAEAKQEVYDNPDVMETTYLNGLLLSQAFWINHFKIISYFREDFCAASADQGNVLEVPVGTGIFIAEFIKENPNWNATAYDLSASSVAFAKDLLQITSPSHNASVEIKDIFDLSTETRFDKLICGELLEHLENPEALLKKLQSLLQDDGKLFLTTAIWAASMDHIYLFKSAQEVRDMLNQYFVIESEVVLNVFDANPEDEKTPINYACILSLNS